ncbi:hypothetical protein N9N28_17955, partial [Rubripirellula amarantea]|nr:hypothetical protein [Rubripirellula amarantea]
AIVVSDLVEENGYVQAGMTMLTLQDTSSLDVTCKLHDHEMNWLWQSEPTISETSMSLASNENGSDAVDPSSLISTETHAPGLESDDEYSFPRTPATVIYEVGGTSFQWSGMLERYDGAGFDEQTRMVPCRVNIDDPDSATIYASDTSFQRPGQTTPNSVPFYSPDLMTGMFVKVLIRTSPPSPLVRLPQQSIQPGSVIWTVKDGKLKRQEISIATSNENFVIAYQQEGGLSAGDKVVISPIATPVEGTPVNEAGENMTDGDGAGADAKRKSGWGGGKRPGGWKKK